MIQLSTKKTNLILLSLILFWCIGIIWEIVMHYFPNTFIFLPFLKYNYSIVCHTEPNKLFVLGSFSTLVCSRCTGIYFGSLLSIIILLFGFNKIVNTKLLFYSSVPMFLDVLLYSTNVYYYSTYIALFTGLLLGSVGFIYIHNSIIVLLNKEKGKS